MVNRSKDESKCKWYDVCPMKRFYERGDLDCSGIRSLDPKWVKDYCFGDNKSCIRYQLEERGVFHPDNMLPDGTIDDTL